MRLFDEIHRSDEGPAQYAEPKFTYLNRSARVAVNRMREVLEAWFSHYPTQEQAELRARFRHRYDWNHRSAFFELFLHELLLQLGCRVVIHPSMGPDQMKHPDFLVQSPKGELFYMEAVLATDESKEDTGAQARMNQVYDALDKQLDSPNFYIGMTLRGAPKSPPPAKRISDFLKERLAPLNRDQKAEILESGGLDALPQWPYEHDGWKIDFFPIPKPPGSRGEVGVRPLGMWWDVGEDYGWYEIAPRLAIRDAIVKKAGRYGDVDLPYLIAVNALNEYADRTDVQMEALFGREQWGFKDDGCDDAGEPRLIRAPDGAWRDKSGPIYTRVSAVLLVNLVSPWHIPRAHICLYRNPWAQRPYALELTRLPQAVPEGNRMKWREGESLGTIFGLPGGWPEA